MHPSWVKQERIYYTTLMGLQNPKGIERNLILAKLSGMIPQAMLQNQATKGAAAASVRKLLAPEPHNNAAIIKKVPRSGSRL